jgi:hypothetical protein
VGPQAEEVLVGVDGGGSLSFGSEGATQAKPGEWQFHVALRSAVGTFTISNPSVGPHSVVVNFSQQTDYLPSGPISINFSVNP